MKIIKTVWYSLFTYNPHTVGVVKVEDDGEIKYYLGTGLGIESKKDAKQIVENGYRFYPEIFCECKDEVEEWKFL